MSLNFRVLLDLIEDHHPGVIAIDIAPPLHSHPVRDGETIILIAHGLTGGSHEHYVRSAVNALRAPAERGGLGARAVVMNFRGCNGSPVITPKLYHVRFFSIRGNISIDLITPPRPAHLMM